MKNQFGSIIICSIVRNADAGLKKNIPVIEQLCSMFKDWKVVIYENDSVDNTKEILSEWQKSNPQNIHVISETLDKPLPTPKQSETKVNPFFSRKRISKMATLRNKYIDYVDKMSWNADYLMVVDLDVSQLKLDGIIDSFSRSEYWDAITAYGYSTSPRLKKRYHDTYALCENGKETVPQTEAMIHSLADEYAQKCKNKDHLIPVCSAFGGLAIYRYEAIRGIRYDVDENDDDRVEVRCEHYHFNREMASRGHDKIYINPKMELNYQALTLGFIIKKIKELL